jgi:hypothetical protein
VCVWLVVGGAGVVTFRVVVQYWRLWRTSEYIPFSSTTKSGPCLLRDDLYSLIILFQGTDSRVLVPTVEAV